MEYFIHSSACIDEGARIGKGTHIWHFSHVMSSATIGENCNIGQNVYIDADVGAGAVVTKDVPDYALVYGNPATIHGWVCECGEKLNDNKQCAKCGKSL